MVSAILLPFGVINESRAECKYNYQSDAFYDENGKHCGTCGTGCSWVIENEVLKITGTGENIATGPARSSGYWYDSVTYNSYLGHNAVNAPWSKYASEFASVDIKGITTIAGDSFKGLTNIKQVTFDDTLTNIGYGALSNTGLTSITLPKNLVSTPDGIFGYATQGRSEITEIIVPDDITEEYFLKIYKGFAGNVPNLATIKCQGTSGDTTNCQNIISKAISRPVGSCYSNSYGNYFQKAGHYCLNINPEFIAIPECPANCYSCDSEGKCTTCLHGKLNKEGSCIEQSACNSDEGYLIDTASASCRMLPGCDTFENGKCTTCIDDYLTNSDGTCTPVADCKNGLHAEDGACVANDDVNCNTQEGNKCTECKGGYLEQSGACVTSCGAGYKQMENWCNRIRYTPAEAAPLLNDDNNTVTITFRK